MIFGPSLCYYTPLCYFFDKFIIFIKIIVEESISLRSSKKIVSTPRIPRIFRFFSLSFCMFLVTSDPDIVVHKISSKWHLKISSERNSFPSYSGPFYFSKLSPKIAKNIMYVTFLLVNKIFPRFSFNRKNSQSGQREKER